MGKYRSVHRQPLGDDDATIQLTYICRDGNEHWEPNALLTVRAKDQDLSADQFEALANCCRDIAAAIRADADADG